MSSVKKESEKKKCLIKAMEYQALYVVSRAEMNSRLTSMLYSYNLRVSRRRRSTLQMGLIPIVVCLSLHFVKIQKKMTLAGSDDKFFVHMSI